jgi:hypothetical protein
MGKNINEENRLVSHSLDGARRDVERSGEQQGASYGKKKIFISFDHDKTPGA